MKRIALVLVATLALAAAPALASDCDDGFGGADHQAQPATAATPAPPAGAPAGVPQDAAGTTVEAPSASPRQ